MPGSKRQTRKLTRKYTKRKQPPARRRVTCHQKKVSQVMHDWKAKKLKSSSGRRVTKHKQAVAIALSVADRKCGGDKTQRPNRQSPRKQLTPWQRNRFNFGGPSKQHDGTLQVVNKIMQNLQLKWTDRPHFVTDGGKIGAWYATADFTGFTEEKYAALIKAMNHKKIGYEIGNSWRAQWT